MKAAILTLFIAATALAQTPKPLAALRLPLGPAVSTPQVKLDFESEPDDSTKAWAEEAAKHITEWWAHVARMLATENFKSPEQLVVHFKNELRVPAYRTPEGLFISVAWIKRRPDDFGMVIHEMTHAIQDYRRTPRSAGWLVEAIADYIRYWHYEPEAPHPRFDPAKATWRDAYTAAPHFLAWLVHKYDRRIVRNLDAALRAGTYEDAIFEKLTGKKLEVLWEDFVAPLKRSSTSQP